MTKKVCALVVISVLLSWWLVASISAAFVSPIFESPIGSVLPESTSVYPTYTPTPFGREYVESEHTGLNLGELYPSPTPSPPIFVSPIIPISPVSTPQAVEETKSGLLCVGLTSGYVLCYGVE